MNTTKIQLQRRRQTDRSSLDHLDFGHKAKPIGVQGNFDFAESGLNRSRRLRKEKWVESDAQTRRKTLSEKERERERERENIGRTQRYPRLSNRSAIHREGATPTPTPTPTPMPTPIPKPVFLLAGHMGCVTSPVSSADRRQCSLNF